ncbi:MAG: carboxypeptidase-like regulatory domain-containing protein, partial [Planctomycetota bacterium]|nr:carboxypeptidase-like regulatory domain-containing protein [Planctomycetota bacterium]
IMLPATRSIIGKVVDEVNQPVFEAAISQTQSSTHRSIKNSVTSDGNGDFEIKIDAKSTQAKLTIEATGYRLQELILKDLSESPTVVLRKIPTLTGVVRDSNKRPVGGATIVLANRSISKEKIGRAIKVEQCNGFATSDANGEFDIIPTNIEDGKELMQLVAFDNDHPPTAYFRSISFSDARKRKPTYKDIVIDMKPGQVISGEVLNNSKVAVDNAQVMLRRLAKPRQSRLPSPDLRRDGTILDQVVVGADGKFVFANQESGDYRLEIYHPDYSPTQSDDFTLRDSAYQCQLIMGAPGGIRGQVNGEIHKFPNLVVQASSPGMELVQVRVDLEGNYEFLNLMPGNYSLEVHDVLSANQGKWWQVAQQPLATADSIEVSPGNYQSQDLTINNSEFASIAGKVTVNGEAAISYSVFAIPHVLGVAGTDQRMVMRDKIMYAREARTNPDGSYEISGIVPNNYWVIVAEPGIRRWMLDSNQPTGLAVQDLALNSAQQHQANFSILTGSVKSFSQGGKNLQGRSITLKPVPADGRQSQAVYVFSNRENVVSGIPEGSYEFTTNKNQAAQRVFVAAGGVTDIQVNLQPRRRSNR